MQSIQYIKKISNPAKRRKRKASSARRKRTRNPLQVLTLGATNPRRKNSMKRNRNRRASSTRTRRRVRRTRAAAAPIRRRRRRRNPVTAAPRRRRNAPRRVVRRRNPTSMRDWMPMGLGGLVGVTATKMVVASLPPGFTATPVMRILSSLGVAFASGWAAETILKTTGGQAAARGVFFGGVMQTMSVALNSFLPGIGAQFGLAGARRNGMGELVSGHFPVPQNPVGGYLPSAAPAVEMSGIARSYGRAY
jgi:hypothetical protein